MAKSLSSNVVKILIANHDDFLGFLESRLGSREAAEDLLQSAFVKSLERGDEVRDEENAVAWFYRVLRNAIADHYRHQAVDVRFLNSKAKDPSATPSENPGLKKAVCQCVKDIIPTLKGEYADILRKVEMEGATIADVARSENITANNAMVRLHRARAALHERLVETCGSCTENGCLDCHCRD